MFALQDQQINIQTILKQCCVVLMLEVWCWHCGSGPFEHLSSYMSPSKKMQAAHSENTFDPKPSQKEGTSEESRKHAGRPPSFSAQTTKSLRLSRRKSDSDSSNHRTLFPFQTGCFKWVLAHRSRMARLNCDQTWRLFAWPSLAPADEHWVLEDHRHPVKALSLVKHRFFSGSLKCKMVLCTDDHCKVLL